MRRRRINVRCFGMALSSSNWGCQQICLFLITNRNTVYLPVILRDTYNCQCFRHFALERAVIA